MWVDSVLLGRRSLAPRRGSSLYNEDVVEIKHAVNCVVTANLVTPRAVECRLVDLIRQWRRVSEEDLLGREEGHTLKLNTLRFFFCQLSVM